MPNSIGMTPPDQASNPARVPGINPNIGKVVTAPNGAKFDFTQVTRSPSTLSPTSGPNAFINGNTGQAMQPMSREAGRAYDTSRRAAYNTGRAQGLARAAEYAKTLDNTPSSITFAKPKPAMPVNMLTQRAL